LIWISIFGLLQSKAIDDVDLFHQIRAGQLMLEQGRLTTGDLFTYTHAGEYIPPVGWLAQIILAVAFTLGSWAAVQGIHAFLMATAYLVAVWPAFRERIDLFSITCAVALGFVVGLTNSSVRPQSFAACCFAILLGVVRPDMKITPKLLGLLPILILWQNAHPSLAVGVVALGAMALSSWILCLWKSSAKKPWGITLVWVLVSLIQLATPMGYRIFRISKENLEISRNVLEVSEWLSPWNPSVREAMILFWVAMAISGIMLVRLRAKVKATDLALFIALTGLTLTSARFGLFWGIAMIPIWAKWIDQLKPRSWFQKLDTGRCSFRASIALLLIGLCTVIGITWISGQPAFSGIPIKGIQVLKSSLSKGRIYNYREWSGPLILEGSPDWRVAIDGRLYLYTKDEWETYNRAASGQIALFILLESHRPDVFFLHPTFQKMLIQLLRESPNWLEIYSDSICSIFTRRSESI
jgi:hypothetical protein